MKKRNWQTRLIHPETHAPEGFHSLSAPLWRGSTVLFPNAASASDNWDQYESGYTYGLYGTPTTLELAARVCELEQGYRTMITAGGQGAISLINLAMLSKGDHVLLPESIYGPNRKLVKVLLTRFGIESSFYPPTVGSDIEKLIRPETRLIWCESPGSITMEVQDVSAIASVAHERDIRVVLDNTWSAGVYFDAFAHGVDITMQALTKYVGGHSDLLLGAVTVKDEAIWKKLGLAYQLIGCAPSPDDCSLALRGMKTMAVRLQKIESSALALARWLADRSEVEAVLHPALESCPGHELWNRDFSGSSGVFSFVFRAAITRRQVHAFVDALKLFGIGYSWGGVSSLVMSYDFTGWKNRPVYEYRIVRLNIGLEETLDLQEDLERAFEVLAHAP